MSASEKPRAAPAPQEALRCTWLARDLALMCGLPRGTKWTAIARSGGAESAVESNAVRYSAPGRGSTGIALLRFSDGGRDSMPESLVLRSGRTEITVARDQLAACEIGVEQLILEVLTGGDEPSRIAFLELLAAHAVPRLAGSGAHALARRLRTLRDAVRTPLPLPESGTEAHQAVSLELVMAIDESSFWIVGWVHDGDRTLRRLTGVTPEGARFDLLEGAYRHRREDVEGTYGRAPAGKHGFVHYVRLPHPSLLDSGWLVEMHRLDGSAAELPGPAVLRDADHARNRVLDEFSRERADREHLRHGHAHPALVRLQEHSRPLVEIEDESSTGLSRASLTCR